MKDRSLPSHYTIALALVLAPSAVVVLGMTRGHGGARGRGSSSCSAPDSCCSRPSRSCSSRCCGARPGRRVAGDRVGADDGAHRQLHRRRRRRSGAVAGRRRAAGAARANYLIPIGRISFDSRAPSRSSTVRSSSARSSAPACCSAPRSSDRRRSPRDYGTNLLGAMVGGVGEYLSLVTGFRALLFLIAACYLGALFARGREGARV